MVAIAVFHVRPEAGQHLVERRQARTAEDLCALRREAHAEDHPRAALDGQQRLEDDREARSDRVEGEIVGGLVLREHLGQPGEHVGGIRHRPLILRPPLGAR